MSFSRVTLDALRIDDERSMRKIPLYARLKEVLVRDRYLFRVDENLGVDWHRATLLNLTFWKAGDTADVLVGRQIPADVVAHVAWHHLARRALGKAGNTIDGALLGESVASAFDVYLLGRMLTVAPRSSYLQSQVEAMHELFSRKAMRGFLNQIAAHPDAAFASLRALLFSVSTSLVRARGIDDAQKRLSRFDGHPFSSLLPHYNLSNWVLHCRAHGSPVPARIDASVSAVDKALQGETALDWLESHWFQKGD